MSPRQFRQIGLVPLLLVYCCCFGGNLVDPSVNLVLNVIMYSYWGSWRRAPFAAFGDGGPGNVAGSNEALHGYQAVTVPAIRPLLAFDRDFATSNSDKATDRSFKRWPTSHPSARFEQVAS